MERSGIRENPGFQPDGLHPGYGFFVQLLNASSHLIHNRLLRLTADSPDLLAVIKAEGRV